LKYIRSTISIDEISADTDSIGVRKPFQAKIGARVALAQVIRTRISIKYGTAASLALKAEKSAGRLTPSTGKDQQL